MSRVTTRVAVFLALWSVQVVIAAGWSAPLRIFAVGDLPYFEAEKSQLEDLLRTAAAQGTPFLIHVGDIKGGSAPCTDANLGEIADLFRTQAVPVVYTPGDNEWTDCHRPRAGAHDPRQRLQQVREIVFSDPSVLRLEHLDLFRPRDTDADRYPEIYAFMHAGILFVALHVVGSNNGNDPGDPASVEEFVAREAANLRFLQDCAAHARDDQVDAVVLLFHANPNFESAQSPSGFEGLRQGILDLLVTYPGPVLAIHGDTHRFKFDQPLMDPRTGKPNPRFTRAEVPGSPIVGGLWITIDPGREPAFVVSEVYPVSRDSLGP
jgi:hypothetical protein